MSHTYDPQHPYGYGHPECAREIDAFSDLLTGMRDLSLTEKMGRVVFVSATFEKMEEFGLALDDFRFVAVMTAGFGSVDEARAWMGATDLDEVPELILEALLVYTEPSDS